jgi:hypothetical protein
MGGFARWIVRESSRSANGRRGAPARICAPGSHRLHSGFLFGGKDFREGR